MPEIEWTILTIGHLSMNRFWGESERRRGPLCTSTLLKTPAGLLLVDPSLTPDRMPDLLNDQAGVRSEDVRYVYLTHFHGDHRFGLEAFPHARWIMARSEIEYWQRRAGGAERALLDRIEPAGDEVLPGIRTLFTPGHTPGLTSLQFQWRSQRVVVAADAAMTQQFFWAREGYHNSTDFTAARESIERLRWEADLVIPGHDNYFLTHLPPAGIDW
jgi:glyoxylase-like metal-dependent hydrolase (beta-lactamase superfamily II)